jgi:hypothetical protein
MKNLLFHLKAVKTGTLKAQVGAGAGAGAETLKVGAGAEKNSFCSATLMVGHL